MWNRYKRTFAWTQILSLTFTITVYFVAGHDWRNATAVFISTQVFAFIGAWWGERLHRKIQAAREPCLLRRRD